MERTYNDAMFRDAFEHHYTWLNGFLRNTVRYASKTAMIDPVTQRTWSYTQLNFEANRLAHALRDDGVGKNDVVTCALMNCPEFAFAFVGARKVGGIVNPINFNLSPGDVARLIDHNRPKVFIYSADICEMAVKALSMCKTPPARVVMADNTKGESVPQGHVLYDDYVKGKSDANPQMDFVPHVYDEVLRLCTSGTTSLPKSVPLNDLNQVLAAHNIVMHFGMNRDDISMHMLPWFHRGGNDFLGPGASLYMGACVIPVRVFSPKQFLAWVQQYKVSFITGSPSALEMLYRVQIKTPYDLSSLEGLVTTGSQLEKAACIRYMEKLTPNIYNCYGATESFCNSYLRPQDLPEHAGTIGTTCVDDDVRIVKIYDDRKAEPDDLVEKDGQTLGELIIWCSCTGSCSYFESPVEEEKRYYKGWMYTGDVGTWTEDFFVTLNGRKDDMIISSGENIYPAQVEEAISGFDRVADVIVTGVPDRLRGQAVAAYIVPVDGDLTVEDLATWCKESPELAAYQRPRYFRITDSLPHTATGKRQHYIIKKQAEEDLKMGLLKKV